jgi:signal transduction histidine kinase/ligand-binding sensor domain-containing protein
LARCWCLRAVVAVGASVAARLAYYRPVCWAKVWLAVAIVLGTTAAARAAQPWKVRHHQIGANILAIAQTPDGYMWFGSRSGLTRFDGVESVAFDRRSDPPFPYAGVLSMAVGPDGALWMATEGTGLVRMANNRFSQLTVKDGLPADDIVGVAFDGERRLWFATPSTISYRDTKGEITTFRTTAEGVPSRAISAVLSDGRGGVVFAAWDRWSVSQGKTLRLSANDEAWDANTLERMLNRSLSEDVRKLFLQRGKVDPLYLKSIVPTDSGFWIATNTAVLGIGDGEVEEVVPSKSLSSGIEYAYVDREQNIWVATTGQGVLQFWQASVRTALTDAAIPPETAFALAHDKEGAIWITFGNRLVRVDAAGHSTTWDDKTGHPTYTGRSLAISPTGDVWILCYERILVRMHEGKFFTYPFPEEDTSLSANAMTIGLDNSVWLGTSAGSVFRFDLKDERITRVSAIPVGLGDCRGVKGNCPSAIRAMATLPDGTIAVGTTRLGLWTIDPATGILKNDLSVATNEPTRFLLSDRDTLWVGSEAGLLRKRGAEVKRATTADGLFDDHILHIVDDGRGALWVAGNRGVFRVMHADLDAFFSGRSERLPSVLFDAEDGLPSNEHFRNYLPGIAVGPKGAIWSATLMGIAAIPTEARIDRAPLLTPLIEHLRIDGRSFAPDSGKIEPPPGRNDVEIQYTVPFFSTPHRISFRYRLLGRDQTWHSMQGRRVAQFTNLPPGNYRFELEAQERGVVCASPRVLLSFAIAPRFSQTSWFYLLIAAAVLALALVVQRLRVRQVSARYQAVIDERNRIARDLHDTMSQVFSAVGFHIDAMEQTSLTIAPQLHDRVVAARRVVDNGRLAARSVIRNLRGEEQSLQGALEELRGFYQGVSILLTTDGDPIRLPTAFEAELLFIAQEAVSNAIEHGKAGHVTIELTYGKTRGGAPDTPLLALWIRDDGNGFATGNEPNSTAGRFGLMGMQERARRIGGRLTIDSEPGVGTEIGVLIDKLV